ncbi:FtsX-like permease family protein [Bifidobacterium asteroides]|uniref:FtsX-like permease family protein n=1 Tax=Bifidobacterium asteroides TaxID=1684 RepID=UPI003A7FC18B
MLEVILVITTVYLAAPILVVLTVSIIGLIPAKAAGGPGLLARQRARKESAGSTAIALPAMMILTIVISLVAAAQAGSIGGAVLSLYPLKADVIATSLDSDAKNRNPSDLIEGIPEVRDFVTYQTQQWAMEGSPGQTATVVWEPAEQLQGQKVQNSSSIHFSFIQGNSSDLGSDRVAVNQDSSYSIGDTVRLLDRHDQPHEARVVALVRSPEGIPELSAGNNYPLFLTAEGDLPQLGEDARTIIPISAANPTDAQGITSRLKSELQGDFAVQTRQEYIDDFIQRGLSGQTAMTVMIVGGTVLALIFMMQSIAISAWERKRQNQRLNQIGVVWRSIVWSGVMETLTDVAGGAVMALLAIAIVEGCIALSFVQAGMSMALTPVPVGRFLLVTVVLLLVAVFTSWVCSLQSRKTEEG